MSRSFAIILSLLTKSTGYTIYSIVSLIQNIFLSFLKCDDDEIKIPCLSGMGSVKKKASHLLI